MSNVNITIYFPFYRIKKRLKFPLGLTRENSNMKILTAAVFLIIFVLNMSDAAEKSDDKPRWSKRVQTVLDNTRPLSFDRENRLPLYLWPVSDPGKLDDASAEYLVKELDRRGIGLVCSWMPGNREKTLSQALPIARAQTDVTG